MSFLFGIDIGGTKTAVGLYTREFQLVESVSFPTEPNLGAESLVRRIGNTARRLAIKNGFSGNAEFVGVACPGPLNLKTGRIIYIPTMGFKNVPIKDMLSAEFSVPVYLENDANCAALAEARAGAGKNFENVVYVTVSTGVGGGIVINGKLYDGASGGACEIGHICVERDGKECACGKKGCLEKYASGTAIAEIASENLGTAIDAKTVFVRARGGDNICCAVIKQAADCLAFALGAVWQIADPDIVVLGGSVAKDFDVLKPLLLKALEKYVQPVATRDVRIALAKLGGDQGMLGAVYNGYCKSK